MQMDLAVDEVAPERSSQFGSWSLCLIWLCGAADGPGGGRGRAGAQLFVRLLLIVPDLAVCCRRWTWRWTRSRWSGCARRRRRSGAGSTAPRARRRRRQGAHRGAAGPPLQLQPQHQCAHLSLLAPRCCFICVVERLFVACQRCAWPLKLRPAIFLCISHAICSCRSSP